VLIRAMTPLEGIDAMRVNRGGVGISRLTAGPAMCCRAFGIDRSHNGHALAGPEIMLLDAPAVPERRILQTPRIGIKKSAELNWRFLLS